MSRKKKIVIPTESEVGQYGGTAREPENPGAEDVDARSAQDGSEGTASSQTEGARSEAEEWKDKCLRARAELANFQRRSEKDRAETVRYAQARLAQALLPVLDDLERVIESAGTGGEVEAVVNGVRLTRDNFLKVLADAGVVPIEALGQPFDPAVHEAIMQQPSEAHAEPMVLQEVQRGYRLHERVLRPARVIVSRPGDAGTGRVDEAGQPEGE
jgi:molecular chaperone GrpE